VFGDISGFGNYEQLTSTKRGEVYDQYWRNRLKMTEDTGDEFVTNIIEYIFFYSCLYWHEF